MGEMSLKSRSVIFIPSGVVMDCRGEREIELEPGTGSAVVEGAMSTARRKRRMAALECFGGRIATSASGI